MLAMLGRNRGRILWGLWGLIAGLSGFTLSANVHAGWGLLIAAIVLAGVLLDHRVTGLIGAAFGLLAALDAVALSLLISPPCTILGGLKITQGQPINPE